MSKNLLSVQRFMTIAAPRYKLGDYVQWSLSFDGQIITYYGVVQVISWSKDCEADKGCWDYITRCLKVHRDGSLTNYHTYDDVPEWDLKPWIGDGIDIGIDIGIDTQN
jgi:hypothetical protein